VASEVVLNYICLVTETQDEILVSVMGIILHHMPQNWAIANRHHWLWRCLRIFAHAHSKTATKQNHSHIVRMIVILILTSSRFLHRPALKIIPSRLSFVRPSVRSRLDKR